ncbi:hypothetical protein HYPSUDRAFT_210227, partial [Hypholoma sublateritium FD-334 SS-4]
RRQTPGTAPNHPPSRARNPLCCPAVPILPGGQAFNTVNDRNYAIIHTITKRERNRPIALVGAEYLAVGSRRIVAA